MEVQSGECRVQSGKLEAGSVFCGFPGAPSCPAKALGGGGRLGGGGCGFSRPFLHASSWNGPFGGRTAVNAGGSQGQSRLITVNHGQSRLKKIKNRRRGPKRQILPFASVRILRRNSSCESCESCRNVLFWSRSNPGLSRLFAAICGYLHFGDSTQKAPELA
jgi:hypothetical protein